MAIVKKSFKITQTFQNQEGSSETSAISFGPRTFGEQGRDILAAKIAAGMISPNPALETTATDTSDVDQGVWFDCESSVPIGSESGTKFDKKFEVYLMNFQLQHREEIVRFLIKDLIITWPTDSQILAEDMLFDSELGQLGDATLHVLHGWQTRHDDFTNDAFRSDTQEWDLVPLTPQAQYSAPTERETTALDAGQAALIYSSGRISTEDNPLNSGPKPPAGFVYKLIDPHPENYRSPLSEAVVMVLERSETITSEDSSVSREDQQRLILSATEPDPLIDPDPFVLTRDLYGFFQKTEYDFDHPPIFNTSEEKAEAIAVLEQRALREVLDHFAKPHLWFANPENVFFKEVWGLEFSNLRPRHSGEHTSRSNWCLGYGDISTSLFNRASYQNYKVLEGSNVAKPLIEFKEFRTPTTRPGDVYRAYFEIYRPKFRTIEEGLVISYEDQTTYKSAALRVSEETENYRRSAAACSIDTEDMSARIAEHKAYAIKRKKEIARKMREHAATRSYRQKRQDSALSYGGSEKVSLNLGPLGSYDFSSDRTGGGDSEENGFARNYSTSGVSYDPKSRTLSLPQSRLKNIVSDAASILKKSSKDMEGIITSPSVNPSQEASLLKQIIPAIDNILKSSKDYQKFVDNSAFSYDPLGVKEPPDSKSKHGVDSKLANIDYQINFEPVYKEVTAEAEEAGNPKEELGLKIKSIKATTSGKSTIITPSSPGMGARFKISPLNRPRTVNYFAQVSKIAKSGEGGIPVLGGAGCGLLPPSGLEIILEFTLPKLQVVAGGESINSMNYIKDTWNSARSGVQEWWNTSQQNLQSNNFGFTPEYNIADIMPSFGPLCDFEVMWDKLLSKFKPLDLICDYLRCLKLPNVNISLDIDFRLPPIPKLPTIDFMNFLRLLLTEMLIEMLKRMLCSMIQSILDALKMDPCPGEMEDQLFGALDFEGLVREAADSNLEGLNDLPGNARIGVRALAEALADTGLPPDRIEDAKAIVDDIFKILTPREVCNLLQGRSSQRVLTAIKNLIEALHDDFFAEHFSVEENILYFFESVGVFIDPDLCNDLENIDQVLGEVTCGEMSDAVSQLREHLQERGKLNEEEIQKLLDIAKDNLDKRAEALSALASGESFAAVVPDLFNPGSDDAMISSLPDSFKNTLETASKAIFETAKMSYISDLSKIVPALYNNKQYVAQPGDPDYNAQSRMELEKATELLRIFEQQLGGLGLDDENRRTVPQHVQNVGTNPFGGYVSPYVTPGDGNIVLKTGENFTLLDASKPGDVPIVNLLTIRESLYVDFVVEYYDSRDGKIYTVDNELSPRIPFYKRSETLKKVDPTNPNSQSIKVLSLTRDTKYRKNSAQLWMASFSKNEKKAAVRRTLYGPQFDPGYVYYYGPKDGKTTISNYRDMAYYCYRFFKEFDDPGARYRHGSSNDPPSWRGSPDPVPSDNEDLAHISILRASLIEDIGRRLTELASTIDQTLQQGVMKVTTNSELLPEIKPYFDKFAETIKNKRSQDVEEMFRPDSFGDVGSPVAVEAVDASLDAQGRPLVSLVFEPSTYHRTFDGRERFRSFYMDNPPSIEFLENNYSVNSSTYSYTVNINDPYLIRKRMQISECVAIPEDLRTFVPDNNSGLIRRDSYSKLFYMNFKEVLQRYRVPINEEINRKIFSDSSDLKENLVKGPIYRTTLESMFEFILFQMANSNLFDETYVNFLEKRLTGTKHYDPATDCIENPTGLSEGNILKFGDLISDMISEVEREYAKPENHPQNMDFSQPGPVEKAFQNVIVKAIIKIFHIEFMLRGALTNSTYSPSYYYNDNPLLDKYFEEFVETQLRSKKAFHGATDKAEETMAAFYETMIKVSGVSQTSFSKSNRDLALRSLLRKEKEKIPTLSNRLFRTKFTKDYTETFTNQLPILEVKPYVQYTSPGNINSDALNLKFYNPGAGRQPRGYFIQDIPQDLVVNGGFYLEHYIRLNQKPGANESFTNFRIDSARILQEKIYENLKDFAETQSFANAPGSIEDVEIDVDQRQVDVVLDTNEDEFKETEVISGREIQVLLADYVENKLFSETEETELERELREEFMSTLNLIKPGDDCKSDSVGLGNADEATAPSRRHDLVDNPVVVRSLPSRLIRRNRTHFKISDFLWEKPDPSRAFNSGGQNEEYIKELFKNAINFDSRKSEETRYYAIPMDACYHYERMRHWDLNKFFPLAVDEMVDHFNSPDASHIDFESEADFRDKSYHYTNYGGPQHGIGSIDAPAEPYGAIVSAPGISLRSVYDEEEDVYINEEGDPQPSNFYPRPRHSGGGARSVKRGIKHRPHIRGPGVIKGRSQIVYHPFDLNAPWFSETAGQEENIDPIYSNKFGTLEKEEFQYVLDTLKKNTECTKVGTQQVEVEDWDEIVIDLYGESSVPYHIPGESFHLAEELPSLSWRQVEYHDFLIPYWNSPGHNPRTATERVNFLSSVPQTLGEACPPDPAKLLNASTYPIVETIGVGTVEYQTVSQKLNHYGVHASPFRFAGTMGEWSDAPPIQTDEHRESSKGPFTDGFNTVANSDGNYGYTTIRMKPPLWSPRKYEKNENTWNGPAISWAQYDENNLINGPYFRRKEYRPIYWSKIKVSRPLGYTPMNYQYNVVDRVKNVWYENNPSPIPGVFDPVYRVEFSEKTYSPNTYYIPIRMLITQVTRRGGTDSTQTPANFDVNASSRGETYVKILTPELLKPQSFKEGQDPEVNSFRKELLQEALDNIYDEYIEMLTTVRNHSRGLNHPSSQGFSPPNRVLEEGQPNFSDTETTDSSKWNYNGVTRAYVTNLPTFAKNAYSNSFDAHKSPGVFIGTARSTRNKPAFFSVSKLYSRACELEAEQERGTFTSDVSKIDKQFLDNPGWLLKDWNEKLVFQQPSRDFAPKADRLVLDGAEPSGDSTLIMGKLYHNTAFGFQFPFFSYIESDDVDLYEKESYDPLLENVRSVLPKNINELIDDPLSGRGFGSKTVATIDTITRRWFGAKRYESFWGETSCKNWLFAEIPGNSTNTGIFQTTYKDGAENDWDTWAYRLSYNASSPGRCIHKNWQCGFEWPNGPRSGMSPFVADGRWTISELFHQRGALDASTLISAFAFGHTIEERNRLSAFDESSNLYNIQDNSLVVENLADTFRNNFSDAMRSLIYRPSGQISRALNDYWNSERSPGEELTNQDSSFLTRSMMEGSKDVIGSIDYMIDNVFLSSEKFNPHLGAMIQYLSNHNSSANLENSEVSCSPPPDAFNMRTQTSAAEDSYSVRTYLKFIIAAELKALGLIIGDATITSGTSRWDSVERDYVSKIGRKTSVRSWQNVNNEYLRLHADQQKPEFFIPISGNNYSSPTGFDFRSVGTPNPKARRVLHYLAKRKPKLVVYPIEIFARQQEFVESINNNFWSYLRNESNFLEEMEQTKRQVIEEVLAKMERLFQNTEVRFGVRLVQVVRQNLTAKIMREYGAVDERLVATIPEEERSYFIKPKTNADNPASGDYTLMTDDVREFVFCNPIVSYEETFPADCVNYQNVYRRYVNEEGRKYLRSKLFEQPEFRALTQFMFPLNKFATVTNIFSTQILASRTSTQEILDTTKVTLMEIFKTMVNRNDFGRKGPFDHLGAAALSNSELFNQFNKHATSEGPDMKCIEFPDMGQFLEALVDQIKNIIYYTPSIILRGIASSIDPMYMDMKQKHKACEPGEEHVKSLKWGATTMYTEKKYKKLGEGTTGCGSNKYAPVVPGFQVDMAISIANLLSFNPKPLGRTLDKFATYLYDADLPFFKFDFEFDIPCLMDEPYEKDYEPPTLGSHGRYGHFLSPITALALSTPELPTEKNTRCSPVCDSPPPISEKAEREATSGCPDIDTGD